MDLYRPITVLHVAPHPDDEVIAAPATLFALRDAGHRVINLACSLGRPADHPRRLSELREAQRRTRFELIVREPPLAISRGDDLAAAERALVETLHEILRRESVDLIASPSPHDAHHGHEAVGRAVREAIATASAPPRWWMWGLWAELPFPTLYTPFGRDRLREVQHALAAYGGELRRNDYEALVAGRSRMNRVVGAERVFGFGSQSRGPAYAELLTEIWTHEGEWYAGPPRTLAPDRPLGGIDRPTDRPLGWWLAEPSLTDRAKALWSAGDGP